MRELVLALASVLLLSVVSPGTATAQPHQFAGIPWGASVETVRAKMAEAGYVFEKMDADGDLAFNGTVLANKAIIFALLFNGKLSKISVILVTPDQTAIRTYDEMLGVLKAKYGKPSHEFRFFEKPYFDGDGYPEQAIRRGKGHFLSAWESGKGSPEATALTVSISEKLVVRVSYEGPDWKVAADQRKAKATKSF